MTRKAQMIKNAVNEAYGDEAHNVVRGVLWSDGQNGRGWYVTYYRSVKGGPEARQFFKSVNEAVEFFQEVKWQNEGLA